MKWEAKNKQRTYNPISSELGTIGEVARPIINVVTKEGIHTCIGFFSPNFPRIQKARPKAPKLDLLQQKVFFKEAIDMFQNMSMPNMDRTTS